MSLKENITTSYGASIYNEFDLKKNIQENDGTEESKDEDRKS